MSKPRTLSGSLHTLGIASVLLTSVTSCASPEKTFGAWKDDGSKYVATAARKSQIITGYAKLALGASKESVRKAMGLPDKASVLTRGQGSWSGKGPEWKPVGAAYQYVVEHTGIPGNWKNKAIYLYFSKAGKLEQTDVAGLKGLESLGNQVDSK